METMEIGSEFWTGCTPQRPFQNNWPLMRPALYLDFDGGVVETLSGRTAIEYAAEHMVYHGVKSIYMPSYCCHTMIEPFTKHGMLVKFYDVVASKNGLQRKVDFNTDCDVIFLMDYFGHVDEETAKIASAFKDRFLIYDATHSVYSEIDMKPYDYVCGSYRKWVDINCGFIAKKGGFPEGLLTIFDTNKEYAKIRSALFDMKADYMNGVNGVQKDDFLDKINYAEEILERDYSHREPDERSIDRLEHTDIYFLKSRRNENAKYLMKEIQKLNSDLIRCINHSVDENETPLFVPVIVGDGKRDELRRFLISKEIYCPVHWPLSEMHQISGDAKRIYEGELSLICDQRYGLEDMKRIVDSISKFINKQ